MNTFVGFPIKVGREVMYCLGGGHRPRHHCSSSSWSVTEYSFDRGIIVKESLWSKTITMGGIGYLHTGRHCVRQRALSTQPLLHLQRVSKTISHQSPPTTFPCNNHHHQNWIYLAAALLKSWYIFLDENLMRQCNEMILYFGFTSPHFEKSKNQ